MAIPADAPLLLLRHGQTTWNAAGRWQGWADAPLSPLGERQARDAVARLRPWNFTTVCASDLERASRTAELIAVGLGLDGEVVRDPQLRERHVGAFEGKTIDELLVEFPDCFHPQTRRLLRVPDGESDDDLRRRTEPALRSLAERFEGETVLVVSHGGVIRTIERHLGIDPGASTPNLGGRWLSAGPDGLVAGNRFDPGESERATAPATE